MEKVTGIGTCSSGLGIPKNLPYGTRSIWALRLPRRTIMNRPGSKKPDRPYLRRFRKRLIILGTPIKSGWSIFAFGISMRWFHNCAGPTLPFKLTPTNYPNGQFARLNDPEGNPIELWQPSEINIQS